jgi:hypothetical protein
MPSTCIKMPHRQVTTSSSSFASPAWRHQQKMSEGIGELPVEDVTSRTVGTVKTPSWREDLRLAICPEVHIVPVPTPIVYDHSRRNAFIESRRKRYATRPNLRQTLKSAGELPDQSTSASVATPAGTRARCASAQDTASRRRVTRTGSHKAQPDESSSST